MKLGVPQPSLRERIKRGHVNAAAEGAGRTEADIIEQDYDYVGCAIGRSEKLERREFRVARVDRNFARIPILRVWYRQLSAIDLLRERGSHRSRDPQAEYGSKSQK